MSPHWTGHLVVALNYDRNGFSGQNRVCFYHGQRIDLFKLARAAPESYPLGAPNMQSNWFGTCFAQNGHTTNDRELSFFVFLAVWTSRGPWKILPVPEPFTKAVNCELWPQEGAPSKKLLC